LVLPGSRARIVRCGGRYDPQLVKRSSEWVSEIDGKVAEIAWCINIFHLTWPMSPSYLAKPRCFQLWHNVEMYYLQQSIWQMMTELVHSKLNMVYLAELLVVMTDQNCQNSCSKCAPRKWTQAPRRRRVSRIAFSLQESDGVACWCAEVPSCWNIKNRLRTTCACLAVASEQETCRDSMPSSFWHQSWAIWL